MQWKREQRLKELISCKYFGRREKSAGAPLTSEDRVNFYRYSIQTL
jgi:hypothetical protein